MSNTLYLECSSGISGDMTVAALIDLGADKEVLMTALKSIPASGFDVKISRIKKAGLDVCDFDVMLDEEHENHDHDMEYLHGNHHEEHDHHHDHDHETHGHEHHHSYEHHHKHEHRGLGEIFDIIEKINMTDNAKSIAVKIFKILARAEAKAHGVPENEVHFHEVGAIDSIVDIIAVAVCVDNLKIDKCIVPSVCEGKGTIRCQHGILPVPVPAVLNIVQDNDITLNIIDTNGEFVTPTGAAIVAALKTLDVMPDNFVINKVGMGAGKREYERPGILRAMLITDKSEENDVIYKLETNLDDCTGEAMGYVSDRLFEAGARDVHFIPVYMKKNRPAYQLNVICDKADIEKLEEIIFMETTTIGIRRQRMERTILKRDCKKVMTSLGEAAVKVCENDKFKRMYPEYKSVVELCKANNKSFQEVYKLVERESYGK